MPYKDTVQDFNLKWANSYAFFGDELVYVHGAYYDKEDEPEEGGHYVFLSGRDKSKKRISGFDLEGLTPILVNSQFFNAVDLDGPSTIEKRQIAGLLLSRSPRRQNKRSLCDENVIIGSPMQSLLDKLSPKWRTRYQIFFAHVDALLAGKYPTYLDGLEYCKKHVSVALSPDFAVGLSSLSADKYLFMSKFGFIGECDHEGIYVKHRGSMQEVIDFVSRNRLHLKVIDAV